MLEIGKALEKQNTEEIFNIMEPALAAYFWKKCKYI